MPKINREDKSVSQETCIVCRGTQWLELPIPHPSQSVRSDGAISQQPLMKSQCATCALVQARHLPDNESLAALYTDSYDIYNNRPASEQFATARYTDLAKAITSAVAPLSPKSVLEAGCGNGTAMQAIQAIWSQAQCVGIEPVTSAVSAAHAQGYNVHQGMIGVSLPEKITQQKYDVIYSIHVIEHTQHPALFLHELKKLLAPEGRIIISCPDGRIPHLELVRSDHVYSMTAYHLENLARQAGLVPVVMTDFPGNAENVDCEYNQLMVCRLPKENESITPNSLPDYLNVPNREKLFAERQQYILAFEKLDEKINSQLANAERLFCFGSGGWACVLAGYAPAIWKQIQACVVDGGSDMKIHGKNILSYASLQGHQPDAVIVGTNPAIQNVIAQRLQTSGFKAICWNNIISM
jgi:2-polyprenyl-3-methyl-5-hydroxy-6-metoxy-1,4-benzoquinol methylase